MIADDDELEYAETSLVTTVGRGDKFGEGYFVVDNTYAPALHASEGANADEQSGLTLGSGTDGDLLQPILNAALNYWESIGIDLDSLQSLNDVEYEVKDLGGTLLAETNGSTSTFDDDAAGYGWSLSTGDVEEGSIDLLSALAHEFGHVLDYEHNDVDLVPVMDGDLAVGERTVTDVNTEVNDWSGAVVDDNQVDLIGTQDIQFDELAG